MSLSQRLSCQVSNIVLNNDIKSLQWSSLFHKHEILNFKIFFLIKPLFTSSCFILSCCCSSQIVKCAVWVFCVEATTFYFLSVVFSLPQTHSNRWLSTPPHTHTGNWKLNTNVTIYLSFSNEKSFIFEDQSLFLTLFHTAGQFIFCNVQPNFFFLSHRSRLPLVPPIERWYFPLLRYRREDGIPAADWTTPVFPTSLGINGTRSGSTSGQKRSRRMEDVRSSVRTASQSQVAEMLNFFEIIRKFVIYI